MAEAITKQCSCCREVKPVTDFQKDRSSSDGSNARCKLCRAAGYEYGRLGVGTGIESVEQVPSVLRAMAELQSAIETEKAVCRKRVALVKEYSSEASESWRAVLSNWRRMLRKFVSKQPGRRGVFVARCEFGSVRFKGGKMTLVLDRKQAAARLGKP